jgi:hypothetical protein
MIYYFTRKPHNFIRFTHKTMPDIDINMSTLNITTPMGFSMERLSNITSIFIETHVLHWHPHPQYGINMPFITDPLQRFLTDRGYTCRMVDMYSSQDALNQLDAELSENAMIIAPPYEETGTITTLDMLNSTPFWAEQEVWSDDEPDTYYDHPPFRTTANLFTEWLDQYLFTNIPLPLTPQEEYELGRDQM